MSANIQRPYLMPDGKVKMIGVDWCRCLPEKRRGPRGGVCWCGGAIPDEIDLKISDALIAAKKIYSYGWPFND